MAEALTPSNRVASGTPSPAAIFSSTTAVGLLSPRSTSEIIERLTSHFAASASANPVSRRDERTPWRDPQSGYVRRNISPPNFPSPIQIVEIVLPAGARVAYETGARDVSIHQQIWVQEGTIEVTLGSVTYRLAEDDCLAMQLNEPTAYRNRTRKAARYIVIIATERARTPRR